MDISKIRIDRQAGTKAGYRATNKAFPTAQAALHALHAEGHLGSRRCRICRVAKGWLPQVFKGGKVRRAYQGDGAGARATRGIRPACPGHAYLDVPANCVDTAYAFVRQNFAGSDLRAVRE